MREVILGVHKLDNHLMHVLDTDKVCETEELVEVSSAAQ